MTKSSHSDKLGYAGVRLRALWAMEKLSVWFCGLYTTPCLTGLLYGYDTVSISGAIDFLQDKYVLSPALQGPVISSSIIGGVGIGESVASYLGTKLSVTVVSAEGLACMCAFA